MTRATIADTAIRLLRTHHTRTTAQIAAQVVKQGISRAAGPAASVERQLRWDPRFAHLTGDRWILVEVLLAVPAAHRLMPQEVASNTLAVGADLAHLPRCSPPHPCCACSAGSSAPPLQYGSWRRTRSPKRPDRAGVSGEELSRLIELGILTPGDGNRFTQGDFRRAGLVMSLRDAGIPLDGLGAAIRGGRGAVRLLAASRAG